MLDDADTAIAGKRKKQRHNFRWYLSAALSNHRYKTAVDVCLATGNILDYQESILSVLSNAELERYVQKNIDFGKVDSLRNCLLRENWVWSPELSKHVLSGIMNHLQDSYYNGDYLANTAHHFHGSMISELKKFDIWNTEGAHLRQQLHQRGLEPLLNFLEMRERIEEL